MNLELLTATPTEPSCIRAVIVVANGLNNLHAIEGCVI